MRGFVVHEVFSVDPESTAYVDDVPLMVAFSASHVGRHRYMHDLQLRPPVQPKSAAKTADKGLTLPKESRERGWTDHLLRKFADQAQK